MLSRALAPAGNAGSGRSRRSRTFCSSSSAMIFFVRPIQWWQDRLDELRRGVRQQTVIMRAFPLSHVPARPPCRTRPPSWNSRLGSLPAVLRRPNATGCTAGCCLGAAPPTAPIRGFPSTTTRPAVKSIRADGIRDTLVHWLVIGSYTLTLRTSRRIRAAPSLTIFAR